MVRSETWFIVALIWVGSIGCSSHEKDAPPSAGEKLATAYCGSCHLPVSPDMLDQKTWVNGVLPAMAPKLGIKVWQQNKYYPTAESGQSRISFADWTRIVNYFKKEAPEALQPANLPVKPAPNHTLFDIEYPSISQEASPIAATTMIKIDEKGGAIYTSDANDNTLFRWDLDLNREALLTMDSPAVELAQFIDANGQEQTVLTTIGTMLAEDISRGIVQHLNIEADTAATGTVIGSELTRPLRALPGDFNKDGRRDWVICVFGHETGGLYLHQQKDDGTFGQHVIFGVPGAEDAAIGDFNGDGWPDLMVLFAYGDEGIWLFTNDQQGGFKPQNILRFSPVFGSTSFELVDMNSDGRRDIVLTNGDNADFSPILKPYHGLRIYLNQGDQQYEQSYFYPINGATKVIVEDFDGDGDRDMAAIAFFADLQNNPAELFTYFQQTARMKFSPQRIPELKKYGRWLAMDAGDVDRDGDIDLVMGNFSRDFISQMDINPSWNTKLPFVLLKNRTR